MDANKRRFTPCQSTRRCGSVLWRCTLISAPRCRPKCELRTNVCAAPGHASCLPKTVHTQTVKSILQSPIEFVSVKNVQPNEITLLGLICTKEFGLSLELSSFCDDSKKEQLTRELLVWIQRSNGLRCWFSKIWTSIHWTQISVLSFIHSFLRQKNQQELCGVGDLRDNIPSQCEGETLKQPSSHSEL